MTTKFVGLKELRQNMARIALAARRQDYRLIVLKKNEPIFELRPLTERDVILERLVLGVQDARDDLKAGRVYSQEVIKNLFGVV